MSDKSVPAGNTNDSAITVRASRSSIGQVVERAKLVSDVLKTVMEKDVHYGIVPGTKKPSLWQPGAEKLLMTFRLAPELEVEDLSTQDSVRYRVICNIVEIDTGKHVGCGVGECSSDEEKYAWRRVICQEEWEETPETQRRKKWSSWQGKTQSTPQVRTNPADQANTVLKMAKKRALVDAAKSTTAASDIFEQDAEDLDAAMLEIEAREAEAIKPPQRKSATEPAPETRRPAAPKPEPQHVDDYDDADLTDGGLFEDQGSDEPLVDEEWDEIKKKFHMKGDISEKQVKRLFAVAKSAGWSSDDVTNIIDRNLGIDVIQIPWGDPYNMIVAWFEKNKA